MNNKITRNTDTGIALLQGSEANIVKHNATSDNSLFGISVVGLLFDGETIAPIPADNLLKRSTSRRNGALDIVEANVELTTFDIQPGDACFSTWKNNNYETEPAAPGCIDWIRTGLRRRG